MDIQERIWAVVPAAGTGKRFGGNVPKQYAELNGQSVLHRTLTILCDCPQIDGVVTGIHPSDSDWNHPEFDHPKFRGGIPGGEERANTVLNALSFLLTAEELSVNPMDWVMVHDAARPCVSHDDIARLVKACLQNQEGALLAIPISDTLKRASSNNRIETTVSRENLWRALTPQMFRIGQLKEALELALTNQQLITDEASAIELAGGKPELIEGSPFNIKITYQQDLDFAKRFLLENKQ